MFTFVCDSENNTLNRSVQEKLWKPKTRTKDLITKSLVEATVGTHHNKLISCEYLMSNSSNHKLMFRAVYYHVLIMLLSLC